MCPRRPRVGAKQSQHQAEAERNRCRTEWQAAKDSGCKEKDFLAHLLLAWKCGLLAVQLRFSMAHRQSLSACKLIGNRINLGECISIYTEQKCCAFSRF